MLNKDIQQINKFKGFGGASSSFAGFTEDSNGISPEEAYIAITSLGKKQGSVTDKKKLEDLLMQKASRDFHKKAWTDDLLIGCLSVDELIEDGYEDIAFDCMKDIVKTTNRLDLMKNGNNNIIAFGNRNWFMDKLNIKYPENSCDCYQCKETYWKKGYYAIVGNVAISN